MVHIRALTSIPDKKELPPFGGNFRGVNRAHHCLQQGHPVVVWEEELFEGYVEG